MSKIFKRHTGGGFTGNQLRDLFASGYNHDIKEAEKSKSDYTLLCLEISDKISKNEIITLFKIIPENN